MLIDSHCHFHLIDGYPDNFPTLLAQAKAQGVGRFFKRGGDDRAYPILAELAKHPEYIHIRWHASKRSAG